MNFNKFKNEKGFTLVESLVAIGILTVAILATFGAVSTSLQNSTLVKDQTTAFFLIQEGMEYIKNIRDENALKNINGGANTWITGLDNCLTNKTCSIDSFAKSVAYCGVAIDSCPALNQNSSTKLYGYTSGAGWSNTVFKRGIQITDVVANQEVRVTIRVTWTDRGQSKYVEVSQSLFNRQ